MPIPDSLLELLQVRKAMHPDGWLLFPNSEGNPQGHFLRMLKERALAAGLNCGHCIHQLNGEKVSCKDHACCDDWILHMYIDVNLIDDVYFSEIQVFYDPRRPWQDEENGEFVVDGAEEIVVRGRALQLPSSDEYKQREIELEEPPRVRVFELCRFLANVGRELVLAAAQERRISVLPDMTQIVQLEDWHHPNVVDNADRPRGSETFQQLAQVLTTGEVAIYHPSQPPNTHWRNWPDGGNL